MKKRNLAKVLALALALTIGLLSAATALANEEPTLVRILSFFGENTKHAAVEQISAEVSKLYPQYKFEATHLSYDNYVQKLKSEIAAGDPPTLITGRAWEFPELIDAGKIVPLTECPFIDNYSDDQKKEAVRNGEVWDVPLDIQFGGVFYRKEMFREVLGTEEPPKTRSEWLDYCKKFQEAGITPIAFGGSEMDPCNYTISAWLDGQIATYDPDINGRIMRGEATFSESEVYKNGLIEAYNGFIPYIEKNDMSIPREKAYDMFLAQERPMTIHGTFCIGVFRQADPDGEFGLFPMPWSEDPSLNRLSVNTDNDFMVTSDGVVDAGIKWLEYLTSVEGLNIWAQTTGCMTASSLAGEVKVDPMCAYSQQLLDEGFVRVKGDHTNWGGLYTSEFYTVMQRFCGEAIDAYAAGEDAETFVTRFLADLDKRFENMR